MADKTLSININNGSGYGAGGSDSSNAFMQDILNKLNATLEKLTDSINKPQQTQGKNSIWQDVGKSIGLSVASAVGIGLQRFLDTQATAILSRAVSSGSFMANTIKGNANTSFGGYVSSLYKTEKARSQSIVTGATDAISSGIGIGAGLLTPSSPMGKLLAGMGIKNLTQSGLNYLTASHRAMTEKELEIKGAMAERQAMASVSQWKTGFGRFGMNKGNFNIVSGGLTDSGKPINVPLASAFENRYGSSQNYNSILNGIVPNLQTHPLDNKNTGNLDKVAQNFLKAGFSASEFSKLTMQSVQMQAMTGKNIMQFSEDIKKARANFGDVFDIDTNQKSLALQSLGYGQNRANNIALQSQYNPSVLNNVNRFANQGLSEWYKNQAIGGIVGFDINKSLANGHITGANKGTEQELRKELKAYMGGADPLSLSKLSLLMGSGTLTPASLGGLLQNKVKNLSNAVNEETDKSPAEKEGIKDIVNILKNGFGSVSTMNVQAVHVNISNMGGINTANRNEGAVMYTTPDSNSMRHSPTGK